MAKLDSIIGGLEIVKKYSGGDSYETAAEHDQFFIYPIKGLTFEDALKLRELGWRQDGVDKDWPPNLDDGWYVFT